MKKIQKHELSIDGFNNRPITLDISIPVSKTPLPLIIFCHGFKGFKDWGHFNWVAESAAQQGLSFLKFNFSHNGIKSDKPDELSDMDAFAENNYSIELYDLGKVIDYAVENASVFNINPKEIYLVGHSRGGGIALLKAAEDKKVKKLALWASLSEFDSFFRPATIEEWQKNGVVYAENKRTGQQLPLKKQFYDDFLANRSKLDVKKAAKMLEIPLLIVHGDQDESVNISHAEFLYNQVQHSIFIKVEGGNHTFGAKHPFNPETDNSEMLDELLENTFEFFLD
ncbi:MAG: alpha/beta hydrolase family protein [Chitinophagaceae bacterium]